MSQIHLKLPKKGPLFEAREKLEEKKLDLPVVDNKELRAQLITRIENIVLILLDQISNGTPPNISYTVSNNYVSPKSNINGGNQIPGAPFNYELADSRSADSNLESAVEAGAANTRKVIIDFDSKTGKDKLALMAAVMTAVHRLLIANKTLTRRSLYYSLKGESTGSLINSQRVIDQTVNRVANLLDCAPWDLNLVATSKGLAAGELILSLVDNRIINFNSPGGAIIPQIISNVTSIRTKARLVLVVEKDSVFQKLLEENCTQILNCILITGKGYPDVATRMLVKILSEKLELPVYIIVDPDPYGVDIMFVYRFGSAALSKENTSLTCPKMRWLGILPSELLVLGVKTNPLTKYDWSKLIALESRPYATEVFRKELEILRDGKAEVENISSSRNFLTATYLSCKIKGNNFI